MKKNIYILAFVIAFEVLFWSCASKPSFEGKGDLCGLVIDENNAPVKDFIVWCKPADMKTWGSKPLISPVLTNESGLFVFYGLSSGQYYLSGSKTNYIRLEPVLYSFNDRTKIICFQTKGFKAAVLSAEELLGLGQKREALVLLRQLSCEPGTSEEAFFTEYIAMLEETTIEEKKEVME